MLVKKTAKIALLSFGLLPFIFLILFFTIVGPGGHTHSLFFIILGILAFASFPVVFVFYIIHACRNKHLVKNQKYLWIALLFVGKFFVFPFYWYSHVWKDNHSQDVATSVTIQPLAQSDIARSVRTTSMEGTITAKRKIAKIPLLLLGLLPLISIILYCIMLFTIVEPGKSTTSLYVFKILAYISLTGAFVFYLIHACRNKHIIKNQKYLWIALLVLGNYFFFPFYWYLHIWKDKHSQGVATSVK